MAQRCGAEELTGSPTFLPAINGAHSCVATAGGQAEHEMFAALEEKGIEPSDQDFYNREDEDTSQLVEQVDGEKTPELEKLTSDPYGEKSIDAILKKRIDPKPGPKKV
jgi:hypothetical protein